MHYSRQNKSFCKLCARLTTLRYRCHWQVRHLIMAISRHGSWKSRSLYIARITYYYNAVIKHSYQMHFCVSDIWRIKKYFISILKLHQCTKISLNKAAWICLGKCWPSSGVSRGLSCSYQWPLFKHGRLDERRLLTSDRMLWETAIFIRQQAASSWEIQ